MLNKNHILILVILTIYGIWITIIYLYCVNIPILDQWITPGEQIEILFGDKPNWAILYRQHNESRMLFPNLIFVALVGILKEWNVKVEMLIGIAFAFLMSLIIYLLLSVTNRSFYKNLCILTSYNLLLLSPSSYSRWLRGITIHRLIPDACIITNALIFRLNINSRLKLLLYSIFCLIAQYSFSGGIVTWPVSLIFIIYNKNITISGKIKSICLFLTLFIISCLFYFRKYIQPSELPEPIKIFTFSFQDIIIYFLSFIGNIFNSSYELSAVIGLILVIAFAILLTVSLKYIREQVLIPWVGIGLYTIALGVLNSITRLQLSYTNALRIDYITHLVYLPLSIIVIFFYFIQFKRSQIQKWAAIIFIVIISIFYINKNFQTNILSDLEEWHHRYSYGKSCIQLVSFYEKHDCIKVLFPSVEPPYPWKLEVVTQRFNKLSSLNILKPGIMKDIELYSQGEWGYIDSIKEDPINGHLKISGWAKISNRAADALILAYNSEAQGLIVIDILPTGNMRKDVSQIYGWTYINSGWSGNIYLKNRFSNFNICNIKAYGFDANENILYPLKRFCS